MAVSSKKTIKRILGGVPFSAELYWLIRQQGKPIRSRFSLKHIQEELPEIVAQATEIRKTAAPGKQIFVFATLHYWIEHAALLSLAMSAQGHEVSLGFFPYAEWQEPLTRFDIRRQNLYARKVLEIAEPLINVIPLYSKRAPYIPLPEELETAVQQVSVFDSQYTLQIEEIDKNSELYKLRYQRNREAAQALLAWLKEKRPAEIIVPNGSIQELGVAYRVAKYLKIPVVTYEFSDQRNRAWIAQNSEVMRQNTNGLWTARKDTPLTKAQLEKIRSLMMARQNAAIWKNFSRLWQDTPAEGGDLIREKLGLDDRPVVLLPTNVIGDSLTLGRQVFTKSMEEWISRTVQYFIERSDVQLVIRVHPGELLTRGHSMVDIVKQVSPKLPEHIHLIKPKDAVNTYDLIEVTDLGLVYTTTVGMEMAMVGLPVIVIGQTHYRERGFTLDPDSYVNYFKLLAQVLEKPNEFRLDKEKVDLAWKYAYHFFFDFPRPFPWHLVRMWDDYKEHPLKEVLSAKGMEEYGETFRLLAGEKMDWTKLHFEN
ncbi:MAG: hypothetical protein ABFD29_11020 [Anaerolineaceae bacterium]